MPVFTQNISVRRKSPIKNTTKRSITNLTPSTSRLISCFLTFLMNNRTIRGRMMRIFERFRFSLPSFFFFIFLSLIQMLFQPALVSRSRVVVKVLLVLALNCLRLIRIKHLPNHPLVIRALLKRNVSRCLDDPLLVQSAAPPNRLSHQNEPPLSKPTSLNPSKYPNLLLVQPQQHQSSLPRINCMRCNNNKRLTISRSKCWI